MSPNVLLNVGLAVNGCEALTEFDALWALMREGVVVTRFTTSKSSTERTVVVAATLPADPAHGMQAVYRAAERLGQDCIAVWDPEALQGALVGPRADQWGDFNPAYFIDFSGRSAG